MTRILLILFCTAALVPTVQSQELKEEDYLKEYRSVTAELVKLARSKQQPNGTDIDATKLTDLQERQRELLNKLTTIAPENPDYKFELAKTMATRGDSDGSIVLLKKLAPLDTAGHPQSHFILASRYFQTPAQDIERTKNLTLAEKHINHVLALDSKNVLAKLLKAKILKGLGKYPTSYQLFEELFRRNPGYYTELADLNVRMGRKENNPQVFEAALKSFQRLGTQPAIKNDDRRWVVVKSGIVKTLQNLDRFEDAQAHLDLSISEASTQSPRYVFLKRLMADNCVTWANKIAALQKPLDSLPDETVEKLIALFSKANQNSERNPMVLQSLTRLSLVSNQALASKARAVYDPKQDVDAPAAVFNQLANHELLNKRFSEAIRYYERAREKSPKDPATLNNLAFACLVAPEGERNPERALQMIDEAIRNLPIDLPDVEFSKFLHTKATALKELNRTEEAIECFERSLKSRPKHKDSLRSLIECFRELDRTPPETYIERLNELDE